MQKIRTNKHDEAAVLEYYGFTFVRFEKGIRKGQKLFVYNEAERVEKTSDSPKELLDRYRKGQPLMVEAAAFVPLLKNTRSRMFEEIDREFL